MNFKEFFLGTPEEQTAQRTMDRWGNKANLTPNQQVQVDNAQIMTRGVFLRRAGATVAGVAVAGGAVPYLISQYKAHPEIFGVPQPFSESVFDNWKPYANNEIPTDSVLAIADSLIKATEFHGFPEAGHLLRTGVTSPQSLVQVKPTLSAPIKVVLKSMAGTGSVAAFYFDTDFEGLPSKIFDRDAKQSYEVVAGNPTRTVVEVELENSIVLGSNAVKALLIAKEISHLAHMEELKDIIFRDFSQHLDINSSSSLPSPDLVLANAMLSISLKPAPPMGFYYRNAQVLLDWAGYWHINQAVGKMVRRNLLTDRDKQVISGNINVLNLAIQRGLVSEPTSGEFVWRQGVGPFSQEWIGVMKEAKGVPILQNP